MTQQLDKTHDKQLRSWVTSSNDHSDFPIQNLPLGVFSREGEPKRVGIAIGASILDLPSVLEAGLLHGDAERAAKAASAETLNDFLALGAAPRRALRTRVSELLSDGSPTREVEGCLHEAASCEMHVPASIGDYTDFYVGIHHAENIGRQFRPDNPLLPNYKYVPIGYHGRASSILPSGVPVRRPSGQIKPVEAPTPSFGPSKRLDYELELGVWIGPGNELGNPIPIAEAGERVAGFCLLNDWSARDIQAWEYQPLGPFLSKNFASTISPWIITPEALAPYRSAQPPRPASDPAPLPYLSDERDQREGAFNIDLEVLLLTAEMQKIGLSPHRLSLSNALHMYWTVAQMVTHHTSGGCNIRPGDLFGTGTISAPATSGCGSILETTLGGKVPIRLESGEERRFLEDGDEIILKARCHREGFATIGFGGCQARILSAI